MGLSISVGLLYDQARNDAEGLAHHRHAFSRLSRALAGEGILWSEPEIADPPRGHTFSGGFPYSFLTHLRRALVLATHGHEVTPARDTDTGQYRRDLGRIKDEQSMLASHLLCHSDSAGYYIPVDFADPLFLPVKAGVEGAGMVGSSRRLLGELESFAASIGIDPADPGRPDPEAAEDPFEAEQEAWHQLHRACLSSIAGGHAIVFH